MEYYAGLKLIVNDNLPVLNENEDVESPPATNEKKRYLSAVIQGGAFAYANKEFGHSLPNIKVVTEDLSGNGAGSTQLVSRRGHIIHPIGYSFNKSVLTETVNSITSQSPALKHLENKDAWIRKFDVKNSKFVFIVTN